MGYLTKVILWPLCSDLGRDTREELGKVVIKFQG